MTTAILFSLTVPAIVATVLTIMLITERDYFFHNKSRFHIVEDEKEEKNEPRKNFNDKNNHWDFSGGTMGL